jgi:hypothetical protein
MNERIKQLAIEARLLTGWPVGEVEYQKFAEMIVRECASKVDWILAEGGKTQGDLIREHFEIPVSSIEAAESLHSDKGYSLGTPEAQEAFERKRGYKL